MPFSCSFSHCGSMGDCAFVLRKTRLASHVHRGWEQEALLLLLLLLPLLPLLRVLGGVVGAGSGPPSDGTATNSGSKTPSERTPPLLRSLIHSGSWPVQFTETHEPAFPPSLVRQCPALGFDGGVSRILYVFELFNPSLFNSLRGRTGTEVREISARICMSNNPLEVLQLIKDAELLL